MATLGTLPAPGRIWTLTRPLPAYSRPQGPGLATEIHAGRHLRVLGAAVGGGDVTRLRVRLHEDGYPCWVDAAAQASPPA